MRGWVHLEAPVPCRGLGGWVAARGEEVARGEVGVARGEVGVARGEVAVGAGPSPCLCDEG